jgi:hypothetical protein
MVMKTRRKRSAAKRVKTAKRRKNNTRSKRGRGHGRGRGRAHGRSAKRGGMTPAARVAARSAAAATKHIARNSPASIQYYFGNEPRIEDNAMTNANERHYGTPYNIPPQSFSEQFIRKTEDTTGDPVEMAITGKGVGDNMQKSAYNDQRRELFANQTPDRPHNPAYFLTPKRGSTLHDIHNYTPSGRPTIYSTPAGPSSDLSSPPPLDLTVRGKSISVSESPSFRRGFAPTIANPNNLVTRLDFGNVNE